MKLNAWKNFACKFLGLVSVLFLFGLLGAVVEGMCSWILGVVFGLVCLAVLNGVCGALLADPKPEGAQDAASPVLRPSISLVQGGNVA